MVEDHLTSRLRPQVYNISWIKTVADRLAYRQQLPDLFTASRITGKVYRRGQFGKAARDLLQLIGRDA